MTVRERGRESAREKESERGSIAPQPWFITAMRIATVTGTTMTGAMIGIGSLPAEKKRTEDTGSEGTGRKRRAGTSLHGAVADGGTTVRKVTAIADTNIKNQREVKKERSRVRSELPIRKIRSPWSNCYRLFFNEL